MTKALTLCFEQGVEDEATEENLAALLALMQMSICAFEFSSWLMGSLTPMPLTVVELFDLSFEVIIEALLMVLLT